MSPRPVRADRASPMHVHGPIPMRSRTSGHNRTTVTSPRGRVLRPWPFTAQESRKPHGGRPYHARWPLTASGARCCSQARQSEGPGKNQVTCSSEHRPLRPVVHHPPTFERRSPRPNLSTATPAAAPLDGVRHCRSRPQSTCASSTPFSFGYPPCSRPSASARGRGWRLRHGRTIEIAGTTRSPRGCHHSFSPLGATVQLLQRSSVPRSRCGRVPTPCGRVTSPSRGRRAARCSTT